MTLTLFKLKIKDRFGRNLGHMVAKLFDIDIPDILKKILKYQISCESV
jgi:hypothetical protein